MPDLTFNKSTGVLKGLDGEWTVRSGGTSAHYAALASGTYVAPKGSLMTGTGSSKRSGIPDDKKYDKSSYGDKKGFHWFFWLGIGNLGIHPDGNVPGTKGCIGVSDSDTSSLFDELRTLSATRSVTVEVVDE